MFGLAGRDPGPSGPGRDSRRGRSPTSSCSTRRRFAMRRPSTSRPGTRPGVKYLFVNGVPLIADGRLRAAPAPGRKLPGRALRLHQDGPADLIVKVEADLDRRSAPIRGPRPSPCAAARSRLSASSRRSCDSAGRSPRVIDRPDAFASPGLIDAHGHMEALGASHDEIDLRGIASLDEVARRVKARIDARAGRLVDHGPELGPEPLAWRRVPDRRRARRRGPQPPGLAQAGRRPRGLGQCRGHAPGQGHQDAKAPRRSDHPRPGRQADRRLHRRRDEPGRPAVPEPSRDRHQAAGSWQPRPCARAPA